MIRLPVVVGTPASTRVVTKMVNKKQTKKDNVENDNLALLRTLLVSMTKVRMKNMNQ